MDQEHIMDTAPLASATTTKRSPLLRFADSNGGHLMTDNNDSNSINNNNDVEFESRIISGKNKQADGQRSGAECRLSGLGDEESPLSSPNTTYPSHAHQVDANSYECDKLKDAAANNQQAALAKSNNKNNNSNLESSLNGSKTNRFDNSQDSSSSPNSPQSSYNSSYGSNSGQKLMNSSNVSITSLVPGGVVTTQNISTVIRPKGNTNSLQFVKIQTPELSKKAVEQIRIAEETRISKDKIKEVDEEWQNNLLNWKSKRRQQINLPIETSRDSLYNTDNQGSDSANSQRKIKTFAEMLEERAKKGNRLNFHLQRYIGAEDDDDDEAIVPCSDDSPKDSMSDSTNDNQQNNKDKLDDDDDDGAAESDADQLSSSEAERTAEQQLSQLQLNDEISRLVETRTDEIDGPVQKQAQNGSFKVDNSRIAAPCVKSAVHRPVASHKPQVTFDTNLAKEFSAIEYDSHSEQYDEYYDDNERHAHNNNDIGDDHDDEDDDDDDEDEDDEQEQEDLEQKQSQRIAFISKLKAFENLAKPTTQSPSIIRTRPAAKPAPAAPAAQSYTKVAKQETSPRSVVYDSSPKTPVAVPCPPQNAKPAPVAQNISPLPPPPPQMPSPELQPMQQHNIADDLANTQMPDMLQHNKPQRPIQSRPCVQQVPRQQSFEIAKPKPELHDAMIAPPQNLVQSPPTQLPLAHSKPAVESKPQPPPPPPPPPQPLAPAQLHTQQHKHHSIQQLTPKQSKSATQSTVQQSPNAAATTNGPQPLPPPQQPPRSNRTSPRNNDTVLSVSGKKRCSNCHEELGRGAAAFVVESLSLVYHTNCFRCSVCHVNLSNGFRGVDVRVHAGALHCQNCYSRDGLNYSRV